jgi:hypothetical protein
MVNSSHTQCFDARQATCFFQYSLIFPHLFSMIHFIFGVMAASLMNKSVNVV